MFVTSRTSGVWSFYRKCRVWYLVSWPPLSPVDPPLCRVLRMPYTISARTRAWCLFYNTVRCTWIVEPRECRIFLYKQEPHGFEGWLPSKNTIKLWEKNVQVIKMLIMETMAWYNTNFQKSINEGLHLGFGERLGDVIDCQRYLWLLISISWPTWGEWGGILKLEFRHLAVSKVIGQYYYALPASKEGTKFIWTNVQI